MTIVSPCFSKDNFDQVYQYIQAEIGKDERQKYFHYQSYDWHLTDTESIVMKKDNYTLAIIDRKNGIYSLAKILRDNQNLVRKANTLFCQLVEDSRKQ